MKGLFSRIAPVGLLMIVLAIFMTADRLWMHVYAPDVDGLRAELRAQAAKQEEAVRTESNDYLDLQNRIKGVDTNVQNALNTKPTSSLTDDYVRDYRIANSLAVLALTSNYGGSGSTASAAGKACVAYFISGTGSFTDRTPSRWIDGTEPTFPSTSVWSLVQRALLEMENSETS